MPRNVGCCTSSPAWRSSIAVRTLVDVGHVVARSDHVHGHRPAGGEGAQHAQRLGMHRAADRDAVAAGGLDGQHHRLGGGGGSVVQEALATSSPVSAQIIDWNSKMVWSVPCEASAW